LPKEKLTGRRVVPTLTASQWVPFLRFKKPQSRFLGRVLRDKLMQKNKRWEGIMRCDEGMDVGEAQGSWESAISSEARRELALAEVEQRFESMRGWVGEEDSEKLKRLKSWLEEGEGSEYGESKERYFFEGSKGQAKGEGGRRSAWAAEPARQKFDLWHLINAETEKAQVKGNKMLEIVEKEKELYEKERQERRDAKRAKRGKGPGGRQESPKRDPLAEGTVAWSPFEAWAAKTAERVDNAIKERSQAGPGTTGTRGSLEWPKREPKSVDTKLETNGDLMERKLQAMQLTHGNAKSAHKKDEPTF
jgi:hypothetical protein